MLRKDLLITVILACFVVLGGGVVYGQLSSSHGQALKVYYTKVVQIEEYRDGLEIAWEAPDDVKDFLVIYANLETYEHTSFRVTGKHTALLTDLEEGERYVIAVFAFTPGINEDRKLIWKESQSPPDLSGSILLKKNLSSLAPILNGTLLSLDSNNFPFIFATIAIDTNNVPVGTLTKNNFQAYENGRRQTSFFDVTPPSSSGGTRLADIIFVLDVSTSMAGEIAAVKANLLNFLDALENSNIDYRIGFVVYANDNYVYNAGNLYANKTQIISVINGIQLDEHGVGVGNTKIPEDGFDALYVGSIMNFRPGSSKHLILITDAPSHYLNDGRDYPSQNEGNLTSFTLTSIVNHLKNTNMRCYVVGPIGNTDVGLNTTFQQFISRYPKFGGQYTGVGSLTVETNGKFYPVTSNFNSIVQDIASNIGNTYIVRYQTDNPACDGQLRNVTVVVNAFGQSDSVKGLYLPCAAPVIQRTQATIDLSKSAQVAGAPITIEAIITDAAAPFVQNAICFYRTTGPTAYKSVTMTPLGSDQYRAIIPAADVQNPGLDYYLTATDGQVTSSDPSVDPDTFPYQIAILPNTPPQITHTPVRTANAGTDVMISCSVVDNTNFLSAVDMYYRIFGTLLFKQTSMTNLGSGQYQAIIPATFVTRPGVEYFIRAVDNFGLSSFNGIHFIQVSGSCDKTAFSDDFEDGVADGWLPQTGSRWSVVSAGGSLRYFLNTTEYYSPDDIRLGEYSLIDNVSMDDFVFECDAKSLDAEFGRENSDLAVVFGYQDEFNYYYVIFNSAAGLTAIRRIRGGVGTTLATYNQSTFTDGSFHKLRVKREGGKIDVYFDGSLIMSATDNVFGLGKLGVGSFNDSGYFDNIVISSPGCTPAATSSVRLPRGMRVAIGERVSVPIIVSTVEDIGLAQFTVEYNRSVLRFTGQASVGPGAPGFVVSQVNSSPSFAPRTPGTNANLVVSISGGGSNTFTGTDKTVLYLNFETIGSAGDSTVLAFDSDCARTFLTTTSLTDICGSSLGREPGSALVVQSPDISGHIRYYDSGIGVKDASVRLSGVLERTVTTDGNGFYQFSNVPIGSYTVGVRKSGDQRNAISGSDALALLRALGFLITLTPEQEKAGDVDGNGSITPADAVAVLRYLAFLSSGTGRTGEWYFEPEVANIYVNSDVSQDFTAYLLGDVTGNWGGSPSLASMSGYGEVEFVWRRGANDSVYVEIIVSSESVPVHTVVAGLEWAGVGTKDVVFRPGAEDVVYALNSDALGRSYVALATVRGIGPGEKVGEFVLPVGRGFQGGEEIGRVTALRVNDRDLGGAEIERLGKHEAVPTDYVLQQNYPNPFNLQTTIVYGIPGWGEGEEMRLDIYGVDGRHIHRLYQGVGRAGYHSITWDGRDKHGDVVSTGIYLCQLRAGTIRKTVRMVVVK